MRVHVFQHVAFEGIGSIEMWLAARLASVSFTRFFQKASLPRLPDFDLLIVMGGPMGANDEAEFSWLTAEKSLIAEAVQTGKPVLGICLGAQLIAGALGSRVYANPHKEIGWFPVWKPSSGVLPRVAASIPDESLVFHWHGDTFDLPDGAVRFFSSAVCGNQAFAIGESVVGLQFHLEVTPDSLAGMTRAGRAELVAGDSIQSESEILSRPERCAAPNACMAALLDSIVASAG